MGMQAVATLFAMALANKLGMNFGGLVGHREPQMEKDLAATFGVKFYKGLFVEMPVDAVQFEKYWDVDKAIADGTLSAEGKNVYLEDPFGVFTWGDKGHENGDINDYLTNEFLVAFRNSSQIKVNEATELTLPPLMERFVAMHVRRGDVTENAKAAKFTRRWLGDDYYLEVARRIRLQLPDADIHAFSEDLDQAAYEKNKIVVHNAGKSRDIHNDYIFRDWLQMLSARVLVTGKSTFTLIPAYLNNNCVVYTEIMAIKPLKGWISGDNLNKDAGAFDEELRACLQKLAAQHE